MSTKSNSLRGDAQPPCSCGLGAEATTHLPHPAARAITAAARSGFTVTALHAANNDADLAALRALNAAAAASDHEIVWCSTTEARADRLRDVANTIYSLTDTHQQIAQGQRQLSAATTIVVDCAATADPAILTDLAEHAAEHRARLLLIDGDDHGWPPTPSGPLLKLLQRDLPWSGVLSVETATPARRVHQPDRDPVLEQADRCNPDVLPDEVTEALEERRRLRTAHNTSHRVHSEIWRQITDSAETRDSGLER